MIQSKRLGLLFLLNEVTNCPIEYLLLITEEDIDIQKQLVKIPILSQEYHIRNITLWEALLTLLKNNNSKTSYVFLGN
jgi:hypothetical protein